MDYSVGSAFEINFSGNVQRTTVESYNGSILSLRVSGSVQQYIVVNTSDTYTIFDDKGNEGLIRPSIPSLENLLRNPAATNEDIDAIVWRMIRGEAPDCMCIRCMVSHINFLRHAGQHPPVVDDMNIILACIHIIDSMIPRMTTRIMNSLNDLGIVFDILADDPNDVIAQVLQESIADGPKRHAANAEVMESLVSRIHPYDASIHKCDTCTICMETFEDIAKEMGKSVMVINCPNCNNCFCAGKAKCDTDAKEDEDCCQGFLRLMDNDNRCPICRMEVKDWAGTALPDISKFKVKETPPINMVVPNYHYARRDVAGSMSGEPMMVSIGMEIPVPEISDICNHQYKRGGERKEYPPMKLKTPYRNAHQKKRNVMRHKRQHYGR